MKQLLVLATIIGITLMTSVYAINYNYDNLNRLVAVNYDKQFINYTYDDGGNIVDIDTNIFLYTINGQIFDKQGNPIPDVMVQVDKRAFSITDSSGYWEIIDLPEDRYNLMASKEGFVFMGQDFEVGNQEWVTELKISVLSEFKLRIIPENLRQPAEQGKNFRFNITAINGGDKTATDASIVYTIPKNTQLVSIRGLGKVKCDGEIDDNNETTCILPELPIGAMVDIKVEIFLELSELLGHKPQLTNIATLYSNYPNIDVVKRHTAIKPYLSVFCEGTPDPVAWQGRLSYECDIELNDNAPKTVAKNVQFTMQLPEELSPELVRTSELGDGLCTTENWPTLTCNIGDLSIVDVNDISEATIVLETILTEVITLQLNSRLLVTADNYEGHSNDITTKIRFGDVEARAIFAIDTTESMEPLINGILRLTKELLQENLPVENPPMIAIFSFKDRHEIKLEVISNDLNKLLNAIERIDGKVGDGGTCPEASAQAALIAVKHIEHGGYLFLATDSLPYDDDETQADIAKLMQIILDKDITVILPINIDDNCIDNKK